MKKHVIFIVYSPHVENNSLKLTNDWSPIRGLCKNLFLNIIEFHIIVQEEHKSYLPQLLKLIEQLRPDINTSSYIIPFKISENYREQSLKYAEFLYNILINIKMDPQIQYSILLQSLNFLRAYIYYLATRNIFPLTLLDIYGPEFGYERPGKIYETSSDMALYESYSKLFLEKKYDTYSFLKSGIKTNNNKFNILIENIEYISSRTKDPILILGPTGAGKSQLVKKIYQLKLNQKNLSGRFIELNCATIKGDTAQSLLFGHIKGSYTGAEMHREGMLKAAHNGLLFLDEVAILGLGEQALLLKAIEEKEYYQVGADTTIQSNFQIICGTNMNLYECVQKGTFRADLLARINMWTFELPSLSQRTEDIEPNLDFELESYRIKTTLHISFTPEARAIYINFSRSKEALWLNNFRDFTASIKRMMLFAETGVIDSKNVIDEINRLKEQWKGLTNKVQIDFPLSYQILGSKAYDLYYIFTLCQLEKVLQVCQACNSMAHAGKKLYSAPNSTDKTKNHSDRLAKYLQKFNIKFENIKF